MAVIGMSADGDSEHSRQSMNFIPFRSQDDLTPTVGFVRLSPTIAHATAGVFTVGTQFLYRLTGKLPLAHQPPRRPVG